MPLRGNLQLQKEDKKSLMETYANKETYESIFTSQEKLKLFTYEDNNIFYGKIDNKNNPILVNTDYLQTVSSKETPVRLCDVAAKALDDMQDYFLSARSLIAGNSNYIDIFPVKGYSSVHKEYSDYISIIYSLIVDLIDLKTNKNIKNINDFMNLFIRLAPEIIINQGLPITRTGFIMSKFCSPYTSGLIVDLSIASMNDDQNKYDDFIKDSNYSFFLETAARFNFLVDKNIPWRLIFEVASPNLLSTTPFDDCGVVRDMGYFKQFDIDSIDEFFETRYYKTMLGTKYEETTELYSFKTTFLQMYNTFAVPNKEFLYGKELSDSKEIKILKNSRDISTLDQMNSLISEEKWLRLLLYLRALETRQKWNQLEFDKYYSKAIVLYQNYGIRNSIDFINAVTRNIFDLDKTSRRLEDRKNPINNINKDIEGFRF